MSDEKKPTPQSKNPSDATPGREIVDPSAEFPLGDEKKSEVPTDVPQKTESEKEIADTDKKSPSTISPKAVSRPESKTRQFFRRFIRWTSAALIVFGLGALAAILLFYIPKSNQLKLVDQDLAAANATISELQAEITGLNDSLSAFGDEKTALEAQNNALQTELDSAQGHILLLNALVDVRTAQYALANEDPAAAGEALAGTADTLTQLQIALDGEPAEFLDSLIPRLELAIGDLETNTIDAQSDLGILAERLLQLEESVFMESE